MNAKRIVAAAWILASAGMTQMVHAADAFVTSPDGRVGIRTTADGASFSVTRGRETLVVTSTLGLYLEGAPALEARKDTVVDRKIPLVATCRRGCGVLIPTSSPRKA
ncbi:hypothetical protein [Hydrocarboniphaga sp.]|uniref:hypothetical protein n=1 Tax=Hydrocarboniphaga sp. TaxID=2033016 RepID=UPI003D0BE2A2